MDRRNQENIIYTSLGIHILKDIFKAVQKGYKQARVERNQIILGSKVVPLDSVYSLNMDRCNQENIVYTSLGIRTLRDIFKAVQKGYKQARAKRNQTVLGRKVVLPNSVCSLDVDRYNQENIVYTSLKIHTLRDIFKAIQKEYKQARLDKLIYRQET